VAPFLFAARLETLFIALILEIALLKYQPHGTILELDSHLS
jgi:hypothetical protein